MKKKFFIFVFFIFSIFLFQNSVSAYSSDPKQFIQEVVDEAKKILVASNSKENREKELSAIALKVADIKGIGLYTLGGYRKELNEKQLKTLVDNIYNEIKEKGAKIKSEVIGETVLSHLKETNKVAYLRFASVYKEFSDASDFEKEVAEL